MWPSRQLSMPPATQPSLETRAHDRGGSGGRCGGAALLLRRRRCIVRPMPVAAGVRSAGTMKAAMPPPWRAAGSALPDVPCEVVRCAVMGWLSWVHAYCRGCRPGIKTAPGQMHVHSLHILPVQRFHSGIAPQQACPDDPAETGLQPLAAQCSPIHPFVVWRFPDIT